MSNEPVIFTKKELYMNQANTFNFEMNEDELLLHALMSGFVHRVSDDQYQVNMSYPEERES